ncbi:MAG: M28 family peptidase [Thermoanaerobaculia bacterium]
MPPGSPCSRFAISVLFVTVGLATGMAIAARPALARDSSPAASTGSNTADRIDAAGLAAAVRFLSSDALEGRSPGSRGDELARLYLATELEAAGLRPGGPEGSWQQSFPMIGIDSQAPPTWEFSGPSGQLALAQREEFLAASGVQKERAEIRDAEVVFVGYGIQAPEYGWDDFKGVDLKGKVLLMLNNDPDWDDSLFAGKRRLYYGRWTYKYESAARQGAAGAILIHTTPSAGYPFQVLQSSGSGEQFELPAGSEPRVQITAWATEEAADRLVALSGRKLADLVAAAKLKNFQPVALGVRTSIALANTVREVATANVAGLLPGSDPALRDEVVIYTAHHDHLGIGTADKSGDTIHNGAVDNATGCAQLLALAKSFAALPVAPRRSLLFLFVAAEEQGLLGSGYYSTHPTFAAGRIAANINLDSANLYGRTRDVTFVGLGKSSLDAVVIAAASAQGRVVHGDPAPEKGSFYRSDQFSFARIGVPAAYLDPGTEFTGDGAAAARARQASYDSTCYHQPCDEIADDWIWDGMIEDTRLSFVVGKAIADADTLPVWNSGDEFEAARKRALAKVAESEAVK